MFYISLVTAYNHHMRHLNNKNAKNKPAKMNDRWS